MYIKYIVGYIFYWLKGNASGEVLPFLYFMRLFMHSIVQFLELVTLINIVFYMN
uniref:Uncharacterized protein n=1 Tax=Marinitoga okinawensis TaxID=389480 RepID=A0A9C7GWJ0_9BACT|nr:Hypothetical protein PMO1_10 [Marinitoga okinawensis]